MGFPTLTPGRRCAPVPLALALAVTATSALAATPTTWLSGTNYWSVPVDWSAGTVPNNNSPAGTTYAVSINTGTVGLDVDPTIDSLDVSNAFLDAQFGHSLTVLNTTTNTNGAYFEIGNGARLSLASFTNAAFFSSGYYTGPSNTLTVSGTFINNGTAYFTGYNDVANVNAFINTGRLWVDSNSTFNITGGGNGITDVPQNSILQIAGHFNVINGNVSSSALAHLATIEGEFDVATHDAATLSDLSVSPSGYLQLVGNITFSAPNIFNSGNVNIGYYSQAANNTLTVPGTFTNNPGSVLRIGGAANVLNVHAFSNFGNVLINPDATLNITGGGSGFNDIAQGSTFNLQGNFNVINGNLTSPALAHLVTINGDLLLAATTSSTDASLSISPPGYLELIGNQTYAAPALTNAGALNLGYFTTGNNTLTIAGTLVNNPSGAIRLGATGNVLNTNSLANAGYLEINASSTLNITGGGPGVTHISPNSTLYLAGNFNVINANVSSSAIANLSSLEGTLALYNSQTTSLANLSISSTGILYLGNTSTLIAGNITSAGYVATSAATGANSTLTVTGTFTNTPTATLNVMAGDTASFATLNNAGTVNLAQDFTQNTLTGGTGVITLNGHTLTLNGGLSQNTIRDNAPTTPSTLISNNAVQTGPLQLATVIINGHHTITLPGSKIFNLSLQGNTGNWTSGLDLAPFAKTILQDSTTHNATLARTLEQVTFGRTHANGIYSSTLAPNQRLVVIDNADNTFSSFGGQPADAGSILLMPTYLGDANLDGAVTITDLNTVLANFGTPTSSWLKGNFDNAPTIDLTDLADVLNNFNQSPTTPTTQSSVLSTQSSTPTPEPTSLALLTLTLPTLLKRRR